MLPRDNEQSGTDNAPLFEFVYMQINHYCI